MFPITVFLGLALVAALCFASRRCNCNCGAVDVPPQFRVESTEHSIRIIRGESKWD
jgi:hypothetical protein